jgi:hypothetical protein
MCDTCCPMARYILSRVGMTSCASPTIQAGEVVRRDESRSSFTSSCKVVTIQGGRAAKFFFRWPRSNSALFLFLVVEVDPPLCDRPESFAIKFTDRLNVAIQQSSAVVYTSGSQARVSGEALLRLAEVDKKLGLTGPADLPTNLDDYLYEDKQ